MMSKHQVMRITIGLMFKNKHLLYQLYGIRERERNVPKLCVCIKISLVKRACV